MKTVIVNYGMGNPGSILNMLKYLDINAIISDQFSDIESADKLILPGVGSFDHGMNSLNNSGLSDALSEQVVIRKKPVLGICLGMHIMTLTSEEGSIMGLGWINAVTKRFRFEQESQLKVPHTGWNRIIKLKDNAIADHLDDLSKFYFVHSYFVKCDNKNDVVCKTNFGLSFDSVFAHENIFGCQFHPEKSHRHGMQIFKNFSKI